MRLVLSPVFLALLAFILAGLVTGCSSEPKQANAENPLEALRAETRTNRYRQAFWDDAVDNKPKMFKKALAFCKSHDFDATQYPNCEYMRSAAIEYKAHVQRACNVVVCRYGLSNC